MAFMVLLRVPEKHNRLIGNGQIRRGAFRCSRCEKSLDESSHIGVRDGRLANDKRRLENIAFRGLYDGVIGRDGPVDSEIKERSHGGMFAECQCVIEIG